MWVKVGKKPKCHIFPYTDDDGEMLSLQIFENFILNEKETFYFKFVCY